jgi:peptidoglycan/xylan/chitin deacetylase (PgdA/CDA1 family)
MVWRGRSTGRLCGVLGLLVLGACGAPTGEEVGEAPPREGRRALAGETVVTLAFSDGYADQLQVLPWLAERGLRASFFIISNRLGRSGYLTVQQLEEIAAAGHEVGGHTLDHVQLANLSEAEQRRQICDDRVNLLALGFAVRSFHYPSGSDDLVTPGIVRACNYNSGSDIGSLGSAIAESIPPADVYDIRMPGSIRAAQSLEDIQRLVARVEESGGGWVMLNFHRINDDPDYTYNIPPERLRAMLDWLAPRSAQGTVVRTQGEIIGGPVLPAVRSMDVVVDGGVDGGTADAGPQDAGAPDAGAPDAGPQDAGAPDAGPQDAGAPDAGALDAGTPDAGSASLLRNGGLEEDADGDGLPDCWRLTSTSGSRVTARHVQDASSGAWSVRVDVSRLKGGGAGFVSEQGDGACTPRAQSARRYRVSGWYRSSTGGLQLVASYRKQNGSWTQLARGPLLPAATNWSHAEWVTPPLPSGATALSVGFGFGAVGSHDVDTLQLLELAP